MKYQFQYFSVNGFKMTSGQVIIECPGITLEDLDRLILGDTIEWNGKVIKRL